MRVRRIVESAISLQAAARRRRRRRWRRGRAHLDGAGAADEPEQRVRDDRDDHDVQRIAPAEVQVLERAEPRRDRLNHRTEALAGAAASAAGSAIARAMRRYRTDSATSWTRTTTRRRTTAAARAASEPGSRSPGPAIVGDSREAANESLAGRAGGDGEAEGSERRQVPQEREVSLRALAEPEAGVDRDGAGRDARRRRRGPRPRRAAPRRRRAGGRSARRPASCAGPCPSCA